LANCYDLFTTFVVAVAGAAGAVFIPAAPFVIGALDARPAAAVHIGLVISHETVAAGSF
jgi:hypothetical protein